VRFYRKRKEISQTELAEKAGMYVGARKSGNLYASTISRLENGHVRRILSKNAYKVAKALDINPFAFIAMNMTDKKSRYIHRLANKYFRDIMHGDEEEKGNRSRS